MVCQKCYEYGLECEYPTTFGCFERDYDCDNGCNYCMSEDECKYESGRTGALVQAFNELVRNGEITCNPFIKSREDL